MRIIVVLILLAFGCQQTTVNGQQTLCTDSIVHDDIIEHLKNLNMTADSLRDSGNVPASAKNYFEMIEIIEKNVKKKNPSQSGSLSLFGFFLQTPAGTEEGRIIVLVIFLIIQGENIAV